jgi:hypothetical protein
VVGGDRSRTGGTSYTGPDHHDVEFVHVHVRHNPALPALD